MASSNSFTVNSEGNFFYGDGGEWDPYIEFESNGKQHRDPDHERMVCELIGNEVLFVNSRPFVENPWRPKEEYRIAKETLVLFVNCNDTFGGGADAESVVLKELPDLYAMYRDNPALGHLKWCALKRGVRPWPRVEERMREQGVWDDQLEALLK